MAFWVILAQIVKIILAVKKYASLLSSLQSGKLVEGLITSFLTGKITDGLVKSGVPLDAFDFKEQAEIWADKVLKGVGDDLLKHDLVIAPETLKEAINTHVTNLLKGKAVGNGIPSMRNQTKSADPVIVHRGEFEREVIDLEVSGAGMDFAFQRSYRSGAGYTGPLGQGWDHAYNLRLREENEFVLVRLTGELAEDRFVRHPRFDEAGFSYYAPSDGIHDVIVPNGAESYHLIRPMGLLFHYEPTLQPGEHRVSRIEDRFENFLDFQYSPEDRLERVLINSTARQVSFQYDALGHLVRIEDHAGRAVVYSYDDWGCLASVVGPALPGEKPVSAERYEYEHVGQVRKLMRVWDAKSAIVVENEYDRDELSDTFGYIIRQAENRGETLFSYELLEDVDDPMLPAREIPTLRVWESWRNGHQIEHLFNEAGNELLKRERFADGCQLKEAITLFRYNADGEIIARIEPDGVLSQFLYARDHLANTIAWPNVDPVIADIPMNDRMSFGNLLATVTRGRRLSIAAAPLEPGFWGNGLPSVKMPDHVDDVVVKYRYDRNSQLLTSISDPRNTVSADPLHVESSISGDPNFNPADPRYTAHQQYLTRHVYGAGPHFALQEMVFPDRTWPSPLDAMVSVKNIVERFSQYDPRGRLLQRIDTRGYEWFQEYYPASFDPASSPKEGFLHRTLSPHQDMSITKDTPDILEIRKQGTWQALDLFSRSSGGVGDVITILTEGTRIALYQSDDLTSIVSTNPHVEVTVDGVAQSPWDQTTHAVTILQNLTSGVHRIVLRSSAGPPFVVGRVRSHVSMEFEIDILGRVLQETDALGHVTTNTVDVLGRIIQMVKGPAANPSVVQSKFDEAGQVIFERVEWRDEDGQIRPEKSVITRYKYDQAGLLLSRSVAPEQRGEKRIIRHRYDAEDNLRETINPRGGRTFFHYDALNRQVRTVRGACSPDCSITRTIYDRTDDVLAQRDPRGALIFHGYRDAAGKLHAAIDTRGRVRIKTDPLGHMVVTDFDAMDNMLVLRQFQRRSDTKLELLSRRQMEYDEHGDLIRSTDAVFQAPILTPDPVHAPDDAFLLAVNAGNVENAIIEFHLDAQGHIVAEQSPVGGVLRQHYDGQGRMFDQVDAEGRRTFRILNGNGMIVRIYVFEPVRDGLSNNVLNHEVFLQEQSYDALGREVARIDAYGNRWEWQYDSLNNRTVAIDPLGNVVRFVYNAFGEDITRVQQRTQTGLEGGMPLPPLIARRKYDKNGNVVAIIDPSGRRTEFTFDLMDRLIATWFAVDPNEPRELRRYDSAHNLISIINRNGLVQKTRYDLLNRPMRTELDASGVAPQNALSPLSSTFSAFKYDATGNLIEHENDYCLVRIQRDSRGLSVSERIHILNIPGAPAFLEVVQSFDQGGRREKLTYPSGREVEYNYDLLGRVTQVKNLIAPDGYLGLPANATGKVLAQYIYIGRRLVRTDLGNGLILTLRFDGRGHVLERSVRGPAGLLWRMQQMRDAAGYIRLDSVTTRTGARTRKFSLDSIYRLTHYGDLPIQWIDLVSLQPPQIPIDPSLAIGQASITAATGSLAIPAASPTFAYDDLGNRIETRESALAPISTTSNLLNQYNLVNGVPWKYDANGNLRSDGVHAFLYDWDNTLQEIIDEVTATQFATYKRDALGRVVAETSSAGTCFRIYDGATPVLEIAASGQTEFVTGHRPDIVVHAAQSGEDFWLTQDGLLSLRLLTNSAGNIVSMPLYRPYGAAEDAEISLSPLRFGYASMWYTPGLPFYHSTRRSYRPDVGRHLQRDPAGLTDNLNLYVYAANNPSSFFDPTGLQAQVPRRIAQKVTDKALRLLARRGKTVLGGHGATRHAFGGMGKWERLGNSIQDNLLRVKILDKWAKKSSLRLPQQARKLTEATLKSADQVIFQHGESRLLYMKVFGRAIGREGETVFRVVVNKATGKIVTYFPSHALKALIMAGAGALTMFEAGVAEAEGLGEQERRQFEKNNQKSGWEELNEWINPLMAVWGGQDRLWEPNVGKVMPVVDKMIQQLEKENNAPLDEETRIGIRMAVINAYTGALPTEEVFMPDPDAQEE